MDGSESTTPANRPSRLASSLRSSAMKRDSLAAELERDPQFSVAKRQQRSQAFTSHIAQASLERQLLAAQTVKMELESKLREKDVTIERLERDRRWLAEREKEERQTKEQEMAEREEEKTKYDSELRSLRNSFRTLSEQNADLQEQHSQLSRSTSLTIMSDKSRISTLERQVEALEDELAEFKRIADDRSRTIQEVRNRFDELTAAQADLSRSDNEGENWSVVRDELHRQASYMRTLESTNAKLNQEVNSLRERYTSIEVLKEEKRGLEVKVRGTEELREKVVRLQAEVEAARKEREEWASNHATVDSPSKVPISVTQSLSALRMTHARLLEEQGATAALLHRRETELSDSERQNAELRTNMDKLQAEVRVLKDIVNRKEQKVVLAEREVGFLQALVASYTAEEAAQEDSRLDEIMAQHVKELQSLIVELKARNRELENELNASGGGAGGGPSRQELIDAFNRERKEKLELQEAWEEVEPACEKYVEKIDELEQTLFELRGEIGGGRHVPPGVRVLSMKENPAQEWADLRQVVMDRLKGENEALIKRLKELEEQGVRLGGDSDGASVPMESWEVVNKEKKELEETVRQKEKRLLRLQQVYTAKGAEFREAIASILGVKLAFYPNGQVRVTSQYDLNASFVFQPPSPSEAGGKMQLVEAGEGGPIDMPQMMKNWVLEENCIPGFLASVTLECYDQLKAKEKKEKEKREKEKKEKEEKEKRKNKDKDKDKVGG